MKKVLILYSDSDIIKDENKRKNYELLYEMGAQKGIKFYRAHIKYNYGKLFKKAFTYKNEKWIEEKEIYPDIVFDFCDSRNKYIKIKKEEIAKNIRIVNDSYFDFIFGSKYLTYSILNDYMSKTFIAYNKRDLINKTKLFKSKIVLKPDRGFGGKNIRILDKKEIKNIVKEVGNYPVIIQDFIDSSSGLGKIAKSTHDLRIIFINHKPIISYVREPIKGFLVANVSLGGKRTMVDLNLMPTKLQIKLESILKKLKIFNNTFYSLDFIFDKKQNPYVLEINSPPSLHLENKKYLKIYYKEIIKFLKDID